ncbi:MAG: hypothetical protein ABI912_02335 [Actinomycetota bacterium]
MSTPADSGTPTFASAFATVMDLGVRAGREVLAALRTDQPTAASMAAVRRAAADISFASMRMPALGSSCGCDIPPPCWMPRQLAPVRSHCCPGATAELRLRVTNCGLGRHEVGVEATGAQAAQITVAPSKLSLDTFEQGVVTLSTVVPQGGGEPVEVLVWVRGCREFAIRWRIEAANTGCGSVHEVEIDDCPDLIHHWYDHFYCERPCSTHKQDSHG